MLSPTTASVTDFANGSIVRVAGGPHVGALAMVLGPDRKGIKVLINIDISADSIEEVVVLASDLRLVPVPRPAP